LLDVDEIVFLHGSDHPHGFAPGAVALVGIDADLAGVSDRLAHRGHHLDVALGFDADLDLDRGDALRDHLGRLARGSVGVHDPDAVCQRRAVANLAAQELIDRDTVDLADRIMDGDIDRGLRVGIAA